MKERGVWYAFGGHTSRVVWLPTWEGKHSAFNAARYGLCCRMLCFTQRHQISNVCQHVCAEMALDKRGRTNPFSAPSRNYWVPPLNKSFGEAAVWEEKKNVDDRESMKHPISVTFLILLALSQRNRTPQWAFMLMIFSSFCPSPQRKTWALSFLVVLVLWEAPSVIFPFEKVQSGRWENICGCIRSSEFYIKSRKITTVFLKQWVMIPFGVTSRFSGGPQAVQNLFLLFFLKASMFLCYKLSWPAPRIIYREIGCKL